MIGNIPKPIYICISQTYSFSQFMTTGNIRTLNCVTKILYYILRHSLFAQFLWSSSFIVFNKMHLYIETKLRCLSTQSHLSFRLFSSRQKNHWKNVVFTVQGKKEETSNVPNLLDSASKKYRTAMFKCEEIPHRFFSAYT